MADVFECIRFHESAGEWAKELQRALSAQEESVNTRLYTRPLICLRRCYILELPDEILVKIFLEVATESSRHVLGIVKTKKKCHDIAIPLLYNHLELLPGRSRTDMQSVGLSFRRYPEKRGYASKAKLRGSPESFRSLGQFPVLFSPDAFPNVRRLHGIPVTVSSLQNFMAGDEVWACTSTIEELIFEESEVKIWPAGLDALMRACKVVRKLVLHWDPGASDSPCDGTFHHSSLGSAIAHHVATLKTLEIRPNASQLSDKKDIEPGSLRDQLPSFSALKDLPIHMACFYGEAQTPNSTDGAPLAQKRLANFLPPSLERLAMMGDPGSSTRTLSVHSTQDCASLRLQILNFLQDCGPGGRFSNLKLIRLPRWVDDPAQGRDAERLPQMKSSAADVNVAIEFRGKQPPNSSLSSWSS